MQHLTLVPRPRRPIASKEADAFPWLTTARVAIVLLLIVAPVFAAYHNLGNTRNFRIVREGVLYRSGQTTVAGLERIIHDHGIRTVVSLRDGSSDADREEEAFCNKQDIQYIRILPRNWGALEGPPPVDAGVKRFVQVMADPRNYPVLVHCFAGTHRSGAYCAIYRMEFEGWSNEQAIAELKSQGYAHLDEEEDISTYLKNYQPRRKRLVSQEEPIRVAPAGERSHSVP